MRRGISLRVAGLAFAGLAILFLPVLSACAPFPRHGGGGFAEHRPTLDPDYTDRLVIGPAEDTGTIYLRRYDQVGLLHDVGWTTFQIDRLDCADMRLDGLLAHGAQARFPAHVWRAQRERRVALRTLSGGLAWDGERRLSAYEDSVTDLARRLDIDPGEIRDRTTTQARRIRSCASVSTP